MSESDYEHLMRLKTMAEKPHLWRIRDAATVECLRWALEQIERQKSTKSACCEQRYRDSYDFRLTAEETAGEVVEVKIPDELLASLEPGRYEWSIEVENNKGKQE